MKAGRKTKSLKLFQEHLDLGHKLTFMYGQEEENQEGDFLQFCRICFQGEKHPMTTDKEKDNQRAKKKHSPKETGNTFSSGGETGRKWY